MLKSNRRAKRKKRQKKKQWLRKRNSRHGRRLRSILQVHIVTRAFPVFPIFFFFDLHRGDLAARSRETGEKWHHEKRRIISGRVFRTPMLNEKSREISCQRGETLDSRMRYADTITIFAIFNRWNMKLRRDTRVERFHASTQYGRSRRARFARADFSRAC